MRLEAPPFYKVITSLTTSKSKGIEIVDKTLKLVEELSSSDPNFGFKVTVPPSTTGGDNN